MQASDLKALITNYQHATRNFSADRVSAAVADLFADDAVIRHCHPFGSLAGGDSFVSKCLGALHQAMPDLERRDLLVMAGTTPEGKDWVGMMGNYMGTFLLPLIDIPPTGHLVHMRYHEYFCIERNKVVEVQAIWDLPELMMQAGAWPLAPQLGAFICTPAPMSGDGLAISGSGQEAFQHVVGMLEKLGQHPSDPDPAVMQLEKFWHPRCNWYGPAGIGTARGIDGFRHWHQIPFLRAMPDRGLDDTVELMSHWIAEGDYVCESGWPNMRMSLTGDGWMGVAPAGQTVELRSLDFWRLEDGLIRENWVLIDLLDFYRQVGVDVLARIAEFNKARSRSAIVLPDGMLPST